jgi:hypothetical protein
MLTNGLRHCNPPTELYWSIPRLELKQAGEQVMVSMSIVDGRWRIVSVVAPHEQAERQVVAVGKRIIDKPVAWQGDRAA